MSESMNTGKNDGQFRSQWTGLRGRFGAWVLSSWPRRVWETLVVGSARPRFVQILALGGDEVVVDAGCGSGYFSLEVARRLDTGKVICVDISGEMLSYLEKRARRANLESRLELRRGDFLGLPVPDDAADIATAHSVLHELTDAARGCGELFRVTRPGGRVVVTDFRDSPRGRRIAGSDHHHPDAHGSFSVGQITALLCEAGFVETGAEPVGDWVIAYGRKP